MFGDEDTESESINLGKPESELTNSDNFMYGCHFEVRVGFARIGLFLKLWSRRG